MISDSIAEKKEKEDFKMNQASLSDYTIRFTGFNRLTAYEELDRLFK